MKSIRKSGVFMGKTVLKTLCNQKVRGRMWKQCNKIDTNIRQNLVKIYSATDCRKWNILSDVLCSINGKKWFFHVYQMFICHCRNFKYVNLSREHINLHMLYAHHIYTPAKFHILHSTKSSFRKSKNTPTTKQIWNKTRVNADPV